MNKRAVAIGGVVVVGIAVVGLATIGRSLGSQAPEVTYVTAAATVADVRDTVSVSGSVQPVDSYGLAFGQEPVRSPRGGGSTAARQSHGRAVDGRHRRCRGRPGGQGRRRARDRRHGGRRAGPHGRAGEPRGSGGTAQDQRAARHQDGQVQGEARGHAGEQPAHPGQAGRVPDGGVGAAGRLAGIGSAHRREAAAHEGSQGRSTRVRHRGRHGGRQAGPARARDGQAPGRGREHAGVRPGRRRPSLP